jgi:hypothetical protein
MSEEQHKPQKSQINPPEINKGQVDERSSYEKLSYQERNIKEGYQPIVDIVSTPPDGGSGVPDKKDK